jgi:putative hydrolase of the HAD superfamily
MEKPKMILFDYGHTLLHETGWSEEDRVHAYDELLKYATKNESASTAADVVACENDVFNPVYAADRKQSDIPARILNKAMFEYLGIEFSLTLQQMETLVWDVASAGAIMPDADRMLDSIHSKGIRSAVVSNLSWSGQTLAERFNRLLPNNAFEFVMTSGDYLIAKPNPVIFEIALRKAGLAATDVWFCGDAPQADIEGAAGVGIFPVWYENASVPDDVPRTNEIPPRCERLLHIHQWSELIDYLERNESDR